MIIERADRNIQTAPLFKGVKNEKDSVKQVNTKNIFPFLSDSVTTVKPLKIHEERV
ncbi:hypothetical protein CWI39_0394p0040 [Hamiltosporidium magnivora]|uniref:Uncharacterized protein n=1 Tax=Hamiltosporidium magnivora TaxID=148818 RepID=A0A4Q9LF64_9MICR|nr:hypothetical protein CWI36_0405p0010 [Hamiltosporidium magnivora]TBU06965.1 hypothetical protein CWI39_0394p0040 [Hamiltosporidium magnivora]